MNDEQDSSREIALRIEPFDLSDLDEVMEIENSSFTIPWSRASYEELYPLDAFEMWVARHDGEMVGYFLVQTVGDEMELHTFAVKPSFRRRHIGRRLLDYMIAEARRRDIRNIFLQVRPSNAPARSLYDRLGFKTVGVRWQYYRDNGEAALVMRLTLTSHEREQDIDHA